MPCSCITCSGLRDCVLLFYVCCICCTIFGYLCNILFPSRGCSSCHLPCRIFVVSSSPPTPSRWAVGVFWHDFPSSWRLCSLQFAFLRLTPPTALTVRERILTMVFLAIALRRWFVLPSCLFRFAPPPRHTGGTRQVFDRWLALF